MSHNPPEPLRALLFARGPEDREAAWSAFLERHSRLILHTARRASAGEDDVMERYTFVLERLREGDFRRLRAFSLNGTGKFTTWLVVVVRRLCVDHHRGTFGRDRARDDGVVDPDAVARRQLAGLLASDVDADALEHPGPTPDGLMLQGERDALLEGALAELETRDRLLLTLRYVDGHPPEKIARMLSLPSRFAVSRRIRALLAELRSKLEAKGFEP